MMHQARWLPVAALIFISGCHGGGSGSAVPVVVGGAQAPQTASMGVASFTVTVPAAAGRDPVPQSAVVALVGASGKLMPVTVNLSASAAGCKTMIGGGLACVASVSAPTGPHTFFITTFAGPNGTGARISTAQTNATVSAFNRAACAPKAGDLAMLQHG